MMRAYRIMSIMKYSLVFIFLWSISTTATAQKKIQWYTWEEMMILQEREPRKIIIDVYTDWCGWCKRMDVNTFQKEDIASYINDNYYAIKFDAEYKEPITFKGKEYKFVKSGRRGYHELAAAITQGRLSFPTTVFLDESLQVLQPIPGYLDPPSMELIITFYAGNYYKDTPWSRYTKLYQSNQIHDVGFRKN